MSLEILLLVLMFTGVVAGILSGARIITTLLLVPLLVALIGLYLGVFDSVLFQAIPERLFGVMANPVLFTVPLFVLMGKLLEHSRLAEKMLFGLASLAINQSRGLSFAVLFTSVVIASASGIVGATITMLAAFALPAMVKAGVCEKLSAGLICAAGSLGQLIPPSIVLILLSDQISNAWILSQRAVGNFSFEPVTIAHLFAAALLPGLMLASLYAVYLFFQTGKTPPQADLSDKPRIPETKTGIMSVAVLLIILAVPVSILFGFATATEAASFGIFGTLLLMVFSSSQQHLKAAISESVALTGVIFGIIMAASVLALVFRGLGGDELVSNALSAMPGEKTGALVAVLLVIFLLGFIIEFIEIIYIVIPVTAPVLFALGVDPIWFAVLVAINLQISFLTPPLGIALFYFQSVSQIRAQALYKAVIPFIILQIFALMIVYLFPKIATTLPSLLV